VSTIKKISPDLERLYKAGDAKEAEKLMMTEVQRVFFTVMDSLKHEIEEDEAGETKV